MATRQTTIRFPKRTDEQLETLANLYGDRTKAIVVAVDRLHQEEMMELFCVLGDENLQRVLERNHRIAYVIAEQGINDRLFFCAYSRTHAGNVLAQVLKESHGAVVQRGREGFVNGRIEVTTRQGVILLEIDPKGNVIKDDGMGTEAAYFAIVAHRTNAEIRTSDVRSLEG